MTQNPGYALLRSREVKRPAWHRAPHLLHELGQSGCEDHLLCGGDLGFLVSLPEGQLSPSEGQLHVNVAQLLPFQLGEKGIEVNPLALYMSGRLLNTKPQASPSRVERSRGLS